ncbi:hypothetical protein K505DRAFT_283996 [Melanomma pulvis-pyrius CBS 109.77]|uniref:Pre-mRNA-splicing factor n=1 Tax=Melanomma pulvis-pyrius CBS 109.77 TaxID=1314802 RepID=A0A6A6WZJ6_9PLEO|nr:hypothetical protein K505DRAFT_283996 [Melanomma pulvis-pyrius CBS 109.77]
MAAPVKLGGFKLSLAGAKNKVALKNPPTNLAKRPRLALDDDEPEDTDKQQEISGFDISQGGALEVNGKKKEEKALPVIPVRPNHNWRDEARRRHAERTGHGQHVDTGAEKEEEGKIAYGLNIVKKDPVEENGTGDVAMGDAPEPVDDGLTPEQRLEKNAIEALLNDKAPADKTTIPLATEEEIFAKELADAPDAPSLDAYEATPIDGFGAALLRGMGWKDGQELGRNKGIAIKPREVKPRPELLGIGAKDGASIGLEPGAWEKGKPKRKAAQTYNPIALRNKITGELVTEEELRERMERQKLDEEREKKEKQAAEFDFGDEPRREKRAERSERKRDDRRRDRDRDDEHDYSSERKHKDRTRNYDRDDRDLDRRRDKRRDKRERSRSPDSSDRRDRDKRRERERSRSRDPQDRRERDREKARRRERERSRDRDRDRGRDSEDSRKRRREHEYDDERDERKRRHRDERGDRSRK